MEKKAKAEAKRLRRINRKQAGNVSDQPVALDGDPEAAVDASQATATSDGNGAQVGDPTPPDRSRDDDVR